MNSPLARFVRLLMLALMLAVSAVAARRRAAGRRRRPSVLRDTETELLFKRHVARR